MSNKPESKTDALGALYALEALEALEALDKETQSQLEAPQPRGSPKPASPLSIPLSAFPPKPRPVMLTVPPSPPSKDVEGKAETKKTTDMPATVQTTPPTPPAPAPTTPLPAVPQPPAPTAAIPPPKYTPRMPASKPAPLRMDILPNRRPMTAMTAMTAMTSMTGMTTTTARRLSFSSTTTMRRPIKYAKGTHARIELVPQPSDDDEDPLNWPRWKKEANFVTLLLLVALAGAMKTAFVAVHSQLATGYAVSYTAAAALTGVPLMAAAPAGLAALAAARFWGKRPVYLAGAAAVLVGALWSTSGGLARSFAQCMAARVFQGLGWGVLDVLVAGSVHDTFFEHERGARLATADLVAAAATWGGPLLGGVVVGSADGSAVVRPQFVVLGSLWCVAAALLALAAPETGYDRSFYSINTPVSAWSIKELPLRPRVRLLSLDAVRSYLAAPGLRPASYRRHGRRRSPSTGSASSSSSSSSASASLLATLLQAPRAMAAPTTLLLALVTLLPFGALWGMAATLSLFFAPLPFDLAPRALGTLLAAPFVLVVVVVGALGLGWPALVDAANAPPSFSTSFPPSSSASSIRAVVGGGAWRRRVLGLTAASPLGRLVATLAAGSLLVFVGLLALGLYIASCTSLAAADAAAAHASAFMVASDTRLRLPAVSFILGLLAAGAYLLDAAVRPVVRRSAQFTSSNLAIAQRNTVDMCGGVALWRTLVAGAFVVALPNAVWAWAMLKATSVGIVVAHVLVAAVAAVAWWRYDETIRRLDGQVMHCVDLVMLKRVGSFFDAD